MSVVEQLTRQIDALGPAATDAVPVPIYYINLDSECNRRRYMEVQLAPVNTRVTRVSGVDGRTMTTDPGPGAHEVDGLSIRTSYRLTGPKLGCTLSHLRAIETARAHDDEWALVCEDDVLFQLSARWPKGILARLMKEGDACDAGIIQLYWGPRSDVPASEYGEIVYQLVHMTEKPCWGTVAYLISKRGQQDILEYTGPVEDATPDQPIFIGDPAFDPVRSQKYAHLKKRTLSGVADAFLYGLTPTYTTSKPLLTFDNRVHRSIINPNHVGDSSLENQKRILLLYNPKHATVLTVGNWDVMGAAQIEFLEYAATVGSSLVVGVYSDAFLETINHPATTQPGPERALLVAALRAVDSVEMLDTMHDVRKYLDSRKRVIWLSPETEEVTLSVAHPSTAIPRTVVPRFKDITSPYCTHGQRGAGAARSEGPESNSCSEPVEGARICVDSTEPASKVQDWIRALDELRSHLEIGPPLEIGN